MSTRYKILNQHATYFLTITTVGWIDIFTRKECRDIIIESLRHCQQNKNLHIFAYVIMSNHLHLMLRSEEPDCLSDVLRDFKKFTAKKIKEHILHSKIESRKEWMESLLKYYAKITAGKKEFTIWQAGNHPIEVYSPKVIAQKLEYIHLNPVRAAWVQAPEHYIYSSASNYILGHGLLEVEIIESLHEIGYVHIGS